MSSKRENPIPPWERIAVDATTAAQMFSIGRSTFFQRVKQGKYPKPANDGRWRVSELRAFADPASSTTRASASGADPSIAPGCTPP